MSIKRKYALFRHEFKKAMIVNELSITSWLAFGATLQVISSLLLPTKVSVAVPLLVVFGTLLHNIRASKHVYTESFTDVKRGRWSAKLGQILNKKGELVEQDGIVLFVLGARVNYPLGSAMSGAESMGALFGDMWKECEKNRLKWGYLGRTHALADTYSDEGVTTIWLTYWRDLESLQAFSTHETHRLGMKLYAENKWPHVGIMHETYVCKKGNFESIYGEFPPFGFGATLAMKSKNDDGLEFESPLVPKGAGMGTMFQRMGRK